MKKNRICERKSFLSLKLDLKMKLTTLFILVVMLNIKANTYAQRARVTLELNDFSTEQVIEAIEEKTDFRFIYKLEGIDLKRIVSINVKEQPITVVLELLFKGTSTKYKIRNTQVILRKIKISKKRLDTKVVETEKVVVQQAIEGTVTDEDGAPLPGASIVEKGTSNGTQSDFDGNFSLSLIGENATLVISYIGFSTKQVVVGEETSLTISLEEDTAGLDEVVIVGFGTQKKSAITGSVVKVDAKDLTTVSVANTTELLSGRVAGVITKQTTGVPGADATELSIRGFGKPLVLVDGIEMSLDRIDPNDIESINVLKDGSAAIYGARAGNGVILVTTKRGKVGKPIIQYTGTTSFQQPTVWKNNVNGGQFVEMQNEGGAASYTPEELALYKAAGPGYETYNWERTVFRTWAPLNQHNLSVRGGSEKIRFFSSFGSLDQGGSFKTGDLNYNRLNVRSNIDANITDHLTFGIDMSYRKEKTSEPGLPLTTIYNQLTVSEPILPPVIPGYPELAANSGGGFNNRGAYGASNRDLSGFIDKNNEVLTGRMQLQYKFPFLEGLSAKASVSYTSQTRQTKDLSKRMIVYEYNRETQEAVSVGAIANNDLIEKLYQFKSFLPSISLNFNQEYGNHSIKGLLLTETIDEKILNITSGRKDLLSTDLPFLNFGSELGITNSGDAIEFGRSSVVGRLNYGYKDRYFLEGSFRYDATSNFAAKSRWGFFPSVSAAWRISEENFIKDKVDFIDNLKLRLSYSETGNDRIFKADGTTPDYFRYLSANEIQTGDYSSYLFGASGLSTALATSGLANPFVTWRDLTTYNIGLDAHFLNGLIGMEFDIFYRLQEGIFATPLDQFPSTFGATLPQVNQNSTDNRGFDLVLTHRNSIGAFKYNVGISFGLAREKYKHWPVDKAIEAFADSDEELNDPEFIRRFNLVQGLSGNWVNRNIGYKTDGIFMNQAEIDAHTVDQSLIAGGTGNERLVPGDIRYIDLNGDGVLNWRDQDEIGKGGLPDMTYGLNLNASYKGFSISALFQGAAGFNFNITGGARTILANNSIPFEYQYKYRWTPDPNDPGLNINPNAILPGSTDSGAHLNNNQTSDFWLQDGKYLRLKNLNIGYDIPQDVLKTIGFDRIRLFVSGSNLITWNKLGIYKGSFDSEGPVNQSGATYPLLKTVSMGINISL